MTSDTPSIMVNNVYGTFVSQKINKIRWKPNYACDSFVAGSWDDEVKSQFLLTNNIKVILIIQFIQIIVPLQENKIALWSYRETDSEDALVKPRVQCSVIHDGDVTELKVLYLIICNNCRIIMSEFCLFFCSLWIHLYSLFLLPQAR